MTVEDPIEFLHRDQLSIDQPARGRRSTPDRSRRRCAARCGRIPTSSWSARCATSRRSRPALLAAETGHLVFSTLHTLDATETINRIIAVFPPHQQKQVRLQLASVLKAVISQRLMPKHRRPGPRAGRRGDDQHAVHPRLHRRQGEDPPHSRRDRRRHVAVRHADVRPVDLRPVPAGARLLRRGAALGQSTSTSSS